MPIFKYGTIFNAEMPAIFTTVFINTIRKQWPTKFNLQDVCKKKTNHNLFDYRTIHEPLQDIDYPMIKLKV